MSGSGPNFNSIFPQQEETQESELCAPVKLQSSGGHVPRPPVSGAGRGRGNAGGRYEIADGVPPAAPPCATNSSGQHAAGAAVGKAERPGTSPAFVGGRNPSSVMSMSDEAVSLTASTPKTTEPVNEDHMVSDTMSTASPAATVSHAGMSPYAELPSEHEASRNRRQLLRFYEHISKELPTSIVVSTAMYGALDSADDSEEEAEDPVVAGSPGCGSDGAAGGEHDARQLVQSTDGTPVKKLKRIKYGEACVKATISDVNKRVQLFRKAERLKMEARIELEEQQRLQAACDEEDSERERQREIAEALERLQQVSDALEDEKESDMNEMLLDNERQWTTLAARRQDRERRHKTRVAQEEEWAKRRSVEERLSMVLSRMTALDVEELAERNAVKVEADREFIALQREYFENMPAL